MAVPPVPPPSFTVTCLPLAGLRVTVNVRFVEPLSPSVTRGELTDSVGIPSLSVIVPVPLTVEIVAFVAPLRVTTTVSFASSSVSPVTDTSKVWLVVPAVKVSVPPVIAV